MSNQHHAISQMCADLGKNPLLVQGAGGNVSWKEGDTLWIKGSGTWLANAINEDIFVPVQLSPLQTELSNQNFDAKPKTIGEHLLRPSIETVLHALMPHKIVAHLHEVTALSQLVSKNCRSSIELTCQNAGLHAAFVEYQKPGPQLAKAVHQALQSHPNANIVLLKNHGIVLGADSIEQLMDLLEAIKTTLMPSEVSQPLPIPSAKLICPIDGYSALQDDEMQALAFDQDLIRRLKEDWVLFPDHAVFLGANANVYKSWEEFQQQDQESAPDLIFIENEGVFITPTFNKAKKVQLRCYYDVISRIPSATKLEPLKATDVYELLNWDAEKLRQQMSQK